MNGFVTRLLDKQLNPGNNVVPQARGRYEPEPSSSMFQPGRNSFENSKTNFDTNEEHLIENISTIDNPARSFKQENARQKQTKKGGIKHVQLNPVSRLQDQKQNAASTGDNKKNIETNYSSKILEQPDISGKHIIYEGSSSKTNIKKDFENPGTGSGKTILKTASNKEIPGSAYPANTKKISSANSNEKTEKPEDNEQVQTLVTGKKPVITNSSMENPIKEDHPLIRPVVVPITATRQVPEKDRPLRNKTNQPVPKLVIGKIIVEILPPKLPAPQKVITRIVQSSAKETHTKSNKLIFGLGQL